MASWYGPGFHGKRTANGEVFDMYGISGAHPTLQIPSMARITNLDNGRVADVRINDRGPFHSNRVMDVSMGAAEKLGFRAEGMAHIRLEVLEEPSRKLAAAAKTGHDPTAVRVARDVSPKKAKSAAYQTASYKSPRSPKRQKADVFIQAGTFSLRPNADHMARKIGGQVEPMKTPDGRSLWRVRLGPFASLQEAQEALGRINTGNTLSSPRLQKL